MKSVDKDNVKNEKRNVLVDQNVGIHIYSLKKVVRGTLIVFIGSILAILFGFIARVLLARIFTQSEYGIFSLGLVLFNFFVMFSLLGLSGGATRQIAYCRGKNDFEKVKRIIFSSMQIVLITSVIFSIILFLASDILSTRIFHDPALSMPLKIFAVAIPFFALISILISIFRGFDRVEERVYFRDILRNILFPLFLIPIIFLGLPFIYVIYAFTASVFLTFIIFVFYSKKKFPLSFKKGEKSLVIKNSIKKDLLIFSLPLLGVVVFQMIISWTDTLMLGGFMTLDHVGLYNAASPLAHFINVPTSAMLLIYAPVVSGLYAKNLLSEIRRNYAILTKWVFSAALPLFLLLFLFPEVVLNSLFGSNYVLASQTLQILSLGFIIASLLGPNGTTLLAAGKTGFLMWASLAAAGINIVLNVALILQLGIVGASIATAVSIVLHCIIRHIKVHSLLKVNPLTKNLLKPGIIFVPLIILISFLTKSYLDITLWMMPVLFILFYITYFLIMLFSKSFDKEDLMMLLEIEKKIGININPLKKILSRFL